MRHTAILFATLAALPLSLTASAAASGQHIPATAPRRVTASVPQGPRTIQSFTAGWRFLQADAVGAQTPEFDDSAWTQVTLPHDWAIAGTPKQDAASTGAGAFMPTGIGWYRKIITVSADEATPDSTRRMFIVFDGVMANSDVYLNGVLLGHRPYGYVSFAYELTPHLHAGVNVIAVRVDDSQQPASRWYPGAGINRQVRLITTGAAHIVPWGTFVTTPAVSAAAATIHVRTTVTNESAATANLSLVVRLIAPNGDAIVATRKIASAKTLTVAPGATADLDAETTISKPDRWDLDHPALYTVQTTLLRDGKAVDEEAVPFGIREFHFDPNKGFFLNGVHHKIYGAALHTDAGAFGTAVPLAAWERRLTELRKLGVNAIRTAHNPPAPEFLDLADRMGFLVMEEMFDCWTVAKNPYDYHLYFKDWSIRDTTDTVMRDRNHPSIILWSAGNEIHDTPHPEIAIPILKSLVDTFHKNDPTRPVTQALFRPNVSHDYDNGLADLLDVIGQNYRENEILKAHADKPTRKIIGTENTHVREQWVALRDHPEYSGQFLWTGVDYLGESRTWPTIGSGSGLLNSIALPHGRAYERQSWWSDKPMVAIVRRVAMQKRAPTDPGYANATVTNQGAGAAAVPPDPTVRFWEPLLHDWTPKDLTAHDENVEIYTNAEEVELFLNGKSLGVEKRHADAIAITFKVPFEAGTLKAVARSEDKVVATDELKTAGKAERIIFTSDLPATPLTPDWNDVRYITATLVDAAGTRIPESDTVIHFATTGPASLVAVDNGNLTDHDPYQATTRKVYYGNAVALVRATDSTGKVTVTASAEGLSSATVALTTAPISAEDKAIAKTSATTRGF